MKHLEYTAPTKESLQIAQTSCKECIFAIWDDKTQVDCSAGRIAKYSEQGSLIEAYDEDREFYVINNRICNYCHNQDWLDRHQPPTHFTQQELLDYMRKHVSLKFSLIVIAGNDIEELKTTIDNVYKEQYKPSLLIVVRKIDCQIRPSILRLYLDTLQSPWRIDSIVDMELDERQMIDNTITHSVASKCSHYISLRSGSSLPKGYLEHVDHLWNDDLKQVGIVISNDKDPLDGMMVAVSVHQYVQGNNGFDIEYKVKEFNDSILYNYSELI